MKIVHHPIKDYFDMIVNLKIKKKELELDRVVKFDYVVLPGIPTLSG